MIRTYLVTFRLAGNDKMMDTRCVTSPLRNTDFESLRKLIAVKRAAKIHEIEIYSVTLVGIEDDSETSPTVINIDGPNYGAIQM
jgi:hypothetical protein